jgi:hypothetical protein
MPQLIQGDTLSKTDWATFLKSPIWAALLRELKDREEYLVDLFKENDIIWNADTIRGKLTELEYFRQIPKSIMASIAIRDANNQIDTEVSNDGNAR